MTDMMRVIESVAVTKRGHIDLLWSNGMRAQLDVSNWLIGDTDLASVSIGDWGHSLIWPTGVEIGADALWRETLRVNEQGDSATFLDWRMRNALSLSKAAEALGISRRSVAYYSNGERAVPKAIQLACKGWDAGVMQDMAA